MRTDADIKQARETLNRMADLINEEGLVAAVKTVKERTDALIRQKFDLIRKARSGTKGRPTIRRGPLPATLRVKRL